MTYGEFYAWCLFLAIAGLAWVVGGFPGVLCLIAGGVVGGLDVGWVDRWAEAADRRPAPVRRPALALPTPAPLAGLDGTGHLPPPPVRSWGTPGDHTPARKSTTIRVDRNLKTTKVVA